MKKQKIGDKKGVNTEGVLDDNQYKMDFFAIENGLIQSKVLEGLSFEVSGIFS